MIDAEQREAELVDDLRVLVVGSVRVRGVEQRVGVAAAAPSTVEHARVDEESAAAVQKPAAGRRVPCDVVERGDGLHPSVRLALRLPGLPLHASSNQYGRRDPAPASFVNVSALIAAAGNGDRAAWNALVEQFMPLVWATARGHRLSDADAADVVQTTWLRLVEHLDRINEPERVGAWLATTARRESLRLIASSARTSPSDEVGEVPDSALGPAEESVRRDRDAVLRDALQALGDRCRLLLRLLASEPPPSYDEISSVLEMPVGSIGPTRGRCLTRLRAELEARGISSAA